MADRHVAADFDAAARAVDDRIVLYVGVFADDDLMIASVEDASEEDARFSFKRDASGHSGRQGGKGIPGGLDRGCASRSKGAFGKRGVPEACAALCKFLWVQRTDLLPGMPE